MLKHKKKSSYTCIYVILFILLKSRNMIVFIHKYINHKHLKGSVRLAWKKKLA